MNRRDKKALWTLGMIVLTIPLISLGLEEKKESFSPYVDERGAIILPADFTSTWVHLGTWVLTSEVTAGPERSGLAPSSGIHQVYTQPDSLKSYQATGAWTDGAALVMEVRSLAWDDVPTGHVMYGGENREWFVMIKDGKARFPDHPNWGNGWGWTLFKAPDPQKNISANCRNDCCGCHEVARETDWVFVKGYPGLER